MSPFSDGAYALRCRVCEDVTRAEPLETCRRCDGRDRHRLRLGAHRAAPSPAATIAAGPALALALRRAAADAVARGRSGRVDPARPQRQPLRAARHRAAPEARGREPDPLVQGPHRDVAVAAARRARRSRPLCCSSTGNLGDAVAAAAAATGLEAIVLAPASVGAGTVAARHPGARVFAVNGTYDDCRRLELELGALFPWGFVSGNLHPYASEGAKTISFEIAEQLDWQLPDAVVCPAASGTLFSKLAQGFSELTRAGLSREPVPRLFAGQSEGSSPIADAFAADRGISRVDAATRRSVARRSATRRTATWRSAPRARAAARSSPSPTKQIAAHTALLAETRRRRRRLRRRRRASARSPRRFAAARSSRARGSCSSSPGARPCDVDRQRGA